MRTPYFCKSCHQPLVTGEFINPENLELNNVREGATTACSHCGEFHVYSDTFRIATPQDLKELKEKDPLGHAMLLNYQKAIRSKWWQDNLKQIKKTDQN